MGDQPTELANGGGNKTTVVGGGNMGTTQSQPMGGQTYVSQNKGGGAPMSNRTVFGDDFDTGGTSAQGQQGTSQGYRSTRKLVGWLVTYSLDPMGVDFKLYEGRNIIGRDLDCNITVNDNMVSAKHAVILFRSGKYSITDQQSSHGTFVNGEDIDLEPRYLNDGDSINMGKTTFKFRTAF